MVKSSDGGVSAASEGEIYYGWWIVAGVFCCLAVSIGVFLIFTFGLYIKPISESLGVTRGEVSLGLTFATVVGLISMPIVGRLVDRYGAPKVILPSAIAFSLVLSLFSHVETLAGLYVLFILLNSVGAGAGPVPYTSLIVKWFDKKRGLALGISLSGLGLGAALMPKLAQYLIDRLGWESSFFVFSTLVVAIVIPAVLLVFRRSPPAHHDENGGLQEMGFAGEGVAGESVKKALKSRRFWLMVFAFFGTAAVIPGSLIHLVPMLTDRGIEATTAANYASLTGISLIVGRILSGYLLDRFFAPYIAAIFWLLPAFGIFIFSTGEYEFLLVLASISLGLSLGAEFDFIAFFVSRYFGMKNYGIIYGLMFSFFSLGAGVGPAVIGYLYDLTQSYLFLPWLYSLLVLSCCGSILFIGAYRYGDSR